MNRILNNQTVKTFLLSFEASEHEGVILDLILVGIQAVMKACRSTGRDILKMTIEQTLDRQDNKQYSFGNKDVGKEIRKDVRTNLVEFMSKSKDREPKISLITEEKQQQFEYYKSPKAVTKKVTEIVVDNVKEDQKQRIDRRNLDDSQARMALTDHVQTQQSRSLRGSRAESVQSKSSQRRKRIQKTYETNQAQTKASPYRSRQKYSTVQSKIKDLVRRDRMKNSNLTSKSKEKTEQNEQKPEASDQFSMFSVQSSLDITNRFLSSKVAQQFIQYQPSSQPPSFSQSTKKVGTIRRS